jgi:hypothetical protein
MIPAGSSVRLAGLDPRLHPQRRSPSITVTRPSLPFCLALAARDIALGLAPPLAGRDHTVEAAADSVRNASSPSGRPISSLRRSAAKARSSASVSSRSAKRGARSMSGRTRTSPSSRPARCAHAGMGPIPGAPDQSRGRRIERHGARRRHQMVIVHGDRTEPPLKQMPRLARPRIDKARVEPMRSGQRERESGRVVRRRDQIEVVGHQAISLSSRRRSGGTIPPASPS